MRRNLERFRISSWDVEVGKISCAVRNYSNIDPFIQDYVCDKLGINSSIKEVEECFTIDYYMKNVDVILKRVGILK